MDEMQHYLRLLRRLRDAEDALLDAGERLPGDLDPLSAEPTAEHVRRAVELLQRVLDGNCNGIAEERLLASLDAGYFRAEPGAQVDEVLEAARKKAREKRALKRQNKAKRDEGRTKESDS
jgi:hypothetical protein